LYNFYVNNSSDNKAISFSKNLHYNNTNLKKLKISDSEFNQWFTGFSEASQKYIVVFGTNLQSTVGNKFTRKELAIIKLAPYQNSVIVGLILSDGWITFASKTNKNARLGLKQSLDHFQYFWFVFFSLSHYCSSYPNIRIGSRLGKETIALQFETRSMPCLTELHSLFYPNGKKLIPYNIL
jgi:hypothetical protein